MPETATKTTTSRRPRAAKATPAKAATPRTAAKAAPVEETTVAESSDRERYVMDLEYQGDTKSYAVFTPPSGSGCVGKFYAPLGTDQVRVALIGPADVVAPE